MPEVSRYHGAVPRSRRRWPASRPGEESEGTMARGGARAAAEGQAANGRAAGGRGGSGVGGPGGSGTGDAGGSRGSGADGSGEGAGHGGLRRGLKNRHIQMIALGGAIGTGLFYGSADAISLAGPSILLAYALGGAVIFLVVRAMGEMSVHTPSSGAFSRYAYDYWSPCAGFVSGWNYWFNYTVVSMAELTVIGTYVRYWLPGIPDWLTAAIVLVSITAVNLVGVRSFGEFEFWFALVKVVAIVGMIVLGAVVIGLGVNSNSSLPDPSFAHLVDRGGFFPNGLSGMSASLVVVMFSFGGVELIGITAGEADDPKRSIPRAVNQVVYRILVFYIGALLIIMAVVPWDRINGKLSPFVQIFDSVGVTAAAHILNAVVVTAALSVYNSGLYSNGRMLHSLAEQGNAPRFLAKLSPRGVPVRGVLVSSATTAAAVVLKIALPDKAFSILLSTALAAGIINWTMIMITQIRFRAKIGAEEASRLTFRLPGGKAASFSALAFLALVVVLMAASPDYRPSVIAAPVWIVALLAGYAAKRFAGRRRR